MKKLNRYETNANVPIITLDGEFMYRLNAFEIFVDEYEYRNLELRYKCNVISFIYISTKFLLASLDYLQKDKDFDLRYPPLFLFYYVGNNFDNHSTAYLTKISYSKLDSKNQLNDQKTCKQLITDGYCTALVIHSMIDGYCTLSNHKIGIKVIAPDQVII